MDEPRKVLQFSAAKPPKAAQLIAGQIRAALRSGELRAGDRLPSERELIAQSGYSRAVVREALRMLENDGLIELYPGRGGGAIVSSPGPEQLVPNADLLLTRQMTTVGELYEARRLLEPLVITLATERATDADLTLLEACLELPPGAPRNPETFRSQNNRFHRLLAEAAHNKVLTMMMHVIMEISLQLTDTHEQRPGYLAEIHRQILDAIARRDAPAATALALAHLRHSEELAHQEEDADRDS
jgi:GntR family transcriptional repressor for pyruvate dehydrogenase complex